MEVSFTFRKLDQAAMGNGDLWMTSVAERTCIMRSVVGRGSRMLSDSLRRALLGRYGLCTAGWALELASGPAMVFGKLSNVLTDGDGWRITCNWNGATSFKPCFRHWNVLKKDSDLAGRRPGYCEITVSGVACCRHPRGG
jgi:hypothetical protein